MPKTVAYVVNRNKFDETLLRTVRLLNVHVANITKLINIRINTLVVQNNKMDEIRKA